jgi:CheY-like chemotaxis protein
MTVKMLEKTGYLAAGAEDGAQALEILAREKYDLVLMDIQMPVLDGVEATRRIRDGRAENVDPNIPVLAMTAYAMKGDREKFLAAGMDDYVSKPVDMKKLDAALREALNRK